MSGGLEAWLERLQEKLDPQPATKTTVVIRCFGGIADPTLVRPPQFCVGRFATCVFIGGNAKERRKEVKRLR